MANVYLTFKSKGTGTTGIVDAFYRTQALADAGATDADITAVQGIHTVSDDFRPDKAYWDGTSVLPETPESVVFDALAALDKLKSRCRETWEILLFQASETAKEGVVHSSVEIGLAHSYYGYAFQWLYLVANNVRVTGQTDWTLQQREKAVELIASGPTDGATPHLFYRAIAGSGTQVSAPTGPTGWVDVNMGTAVALNTAITTTNSMMLDVNKLPSTSIADGSWIDSIAS